MSFFAALVTLVGALASPLPPDADGWTVRPAEGDRGEVLTLISSGAVSYRFECAADAVVVTNTGVTKLLDLKTGKQIGDGPDAIMPPGTAKLAVFAGEGQPRFQSASAVRNPAGGWDLTIRLPKDDKQLKAVGKSEMMSIFTTGFTMAVTIDAKQRAIWNGFLDRCKVTG